MGRPKVEYSGNKEKEILMGDQDGRECPLLYSQSTATAFVENTTGLPDVSASVGVTDKMGLVIG